MIISKKYKYVFIELPFTGSTAISAELRANYHGESILKKHSRYHEFLNSASNEEKKYFIFSCIRNPMDVVVSSFYKKKYNHDNRFTTPSEYKINGGSITKKDLRIYNYIQKHDLEFSEYFNKYFKIPFDNWSRLAHKNFNFIIRFENLQQDFAKVLKLLNIEQVSPLPQKNRTVAKQKNFGDLFEPSIRGKAVRIFGPFMEDWNYTFPDDWGKINVPLISKIQYEIFGSIKTAYWSLGGKSSFRQRRLRKIQNHN